MAAEVTVRLLRREGYKELGVSSPAERTLAAQYVGALKREYGTSTVRPLINRVLAVAERRAARENTGTPGPGGTQEPRYASGGPRAGTEPVRGGTGQGVRPASVQEGLPAGRGDGDLVSPGPPTGYRPTQVEGLPATGTDVTAAASNKKLFRGPTRIESKQSSRLRDLFKTPEDTTDSTESKQGGPGLWISPQGKAIPLTGENGIATHGQTAMKITGAADSRTA